MTAVWGRLPLRTQLTAVFALLLLVGLGLTGVAAQGLLRQSLVSQVDAQLETAAPALVEEFTSGLPSRGTSTDGTQPSDYHVRVAGTDGVTLKQWAATSSTAAIPSIPRLTAEEVLALDGEAYTVASAAGPGRWRVLSRALVSGDTVVGSVSVALPLTAADATLARMQAALTAIGVGVVSLGAVAGWWGVRRALRPLREIEDTAQAIAAGDLARRVPDGPTSTEVGRLAAALNVMLTQIEQAFTDRTASEERMRRFVADASHELRTPLATIRGYGELYRMGALREQAEVETTLRRIEDSATRMGVLVNDLLQLARLDEKRPLRHEEVDLAVLAGDAVADLHALDPTRPARLEPVGGSVAGAVVLGDDGRLRQVLANLVGNVVQHTPPGTPVELGVGRDGDRVVLEVRDHGPGIDPAHASRVFERFYRVDASRGRETGGAGLGMAIVAAIVAAHEGTVDITQTPGGGTTVRVSLPPVAV
ncbi:HAMP domain-containing histidine kinase [Actinotalea sp. BY-33]|uniref:histidine kinase n=1 Tax=Actinotalea soli TaxID=2819234 RepID=A0A939LSF7_9CELL|nr:HAMP domain-containing sensor histidine kinase [Actinotalea soli]MBO1752210.1 HAMP domain-containing histidine kinase [Actinotalea soli]